VAGSAGVYHVTGARWWARILGEEDAGGAKLSVRGKTRCSPAEVPSCMLVYKIQKPHRTWSRPPTNNSTSSANNNSTSSLRGDPHADLYRIRILCTSLNIFHKPTMVGRLSMKTKKTIQSGQSCLTEENLRLHSSTYSKVRDIS